MNYSVLNSLLNQDKTVIIGDWVFRVDYNLEKVIVMNVSSLNSDNYQYLLNHSEDDELLRVYNFDQEVLREIEILETSMYGRIKFVRRLISWANGLFGAGSSGGLFCSAPFAPTKNDASTENFGQNFRCKIDVSYKSAGIYFGLHAKSITQWRLGPLWLPKNLRQTLATNMSWQMRCGNSGSNTNLQSCNLLDNNQIQVTNSRQPYSNIRALSSYSARAQSTIYNGNTCSAAYTTRVVAISH